MIAFIVALPVFADMEEDEIYRLERQFGTNDKLESETLYGQPWIETERGERFYFHKETRGPDGVVYVLEDGVGDLGDNKGYLAERTISDAKVVWFPFEERVKRLRDEGVDEKYIQMLIDSNNGSNTPYKPVKIYPGFRERLNETPAGSTLRIAVMLDHQPRINLPGADLDSDVFLPTLINQAWEERYEAIYDRKSEFAALQEPIVQFIEENGGQIYARHWLVNALYAEVPVELVDLLAERDDVSLLHMDSDAEDLSISYRNLRSVTQGDNYRLNNFTGLNGTTANNPPGYDSDRIVVAVVEKQPFNDDHTSYRDGFIQAPFRIYEKVDCSDYSAGNDCVLGQLDDRCYYDGCVNNVCSTCPTTTEAQLWLSHARIAGIIGQDLSQYQDATYTTEGDRLDRTGMAPEVDLMLISRGLASKSKSKASFETAVELGADIINFSAGFTDNENDTHCPDEIQSRGIDSVSGSVNEAYEAGVFFAQGSGNNADSSSSKYCSNIFKVVAPGNASGAFTVGAYDVSPSGGSYENPDSAFWTTGLRKAYSSYGYTYDGRTKPDLVAPTDIDCAPHRVNNNGVNGYYCSEASEGTSSSTPVLAGAAALFKDWYGYLLGPGTVWDNPGKLFVNLLNFGDRMNNSGVGYSGYSYKYGAGRLRLRLPTGRGMDSPWRWKTGQITLEDGEMFQRWLGPVKNETGNIPDDVNFLKVAVWWMEYNTASGQDKALISAKVCQRNWLGLYYCETKANTSTDQKIQFIYDDNEAGFDNFHGDRGYYLRVDADSIPDGGTEDGYRTIYYSVIWEDLDRDDSDGPCHLCSPVDTRDPIFYR